MNSNHGIYKLAVKAKQGDDNSKITIIENYAGLIKRFSVTLKLKGIISYEDAEAELKATILDSIYKLKYFGNESKDHGNPLTKYFYKALKNKYIILSKANDNIFTHEVALTSDQDIEVTQAEDLAEIIISDISLKELLDKLTKIQRIVIIEKYIKDLPDIVIAEHLNISRQRVNQVKNTALKKLRNNIAAAKKEGEFKDGK